MQLDTVKEELGNVWCINGLVVWDDVDFLYAPWKENLLRVTF